ncbi:MULTISPECIES: MbtH family NRPS accessory protein [unclassified Streptomyces]|uniref:MbtH family protein n=1 Tax=unclassified Streptomyces TaxID=2593676 RepID=UPI0033D6F775
MSDSLFDDVDGTFVVVVNAENQHSLWPVRLEVPAGWDAVTEPGTRQAALDYVESHWTDIRPASLVRN